MERTRERLEAILSEVHPGARVDLINFLLGYEGRGGVTAVREAVRDGRIAKVRGADCIYVVRATTTGGAGV